MPLTTGRVPLSWLELVGGRLGISRVCLCGRNGGVDSAEERRGDKGGEAYRETGRLHMGMGSPASASSMRRRGIEFPFC